jgi:Xaa-Pro aminopeptidase
MAEQVSFHPEREFDEALALIHDETIHPADLGGREPAYPDFPLHEYRTRYARLTRLLQAHDLDALVLTQEETIRYLSGYVSVIWAVGRWLPGCMIATRDPREAVLLPSAFDTGAAEGTSWVGTVDGHPDPAAIPAMVDGHLRRLGLRRDRIGTETGPGSVVMLPWPVATALMDVLGGTPVDATRLVSTLRMVKSEAELDRIRHTVRATTAGYRAALQACRAGMTERELVAVASATMHREGISAGTKPVFLNCVAGRDRHPLVDTTASDRPFAEGDVVFLDGGGARDGYLSDIIRQVAIGRISDAAERYAEVAHSALEAVLAAVRPGRRVSELFAAGQDVFDREGLGASGGGLSGHGIGLELWERPFVRDHTGDPVEDVTLRPGMTLSLEPILLPHDEAGLVGVFVVENQVRVTPDGVEVLSGDLPTRLWRAPA